MTSAVLTLRQLEAFYGDFQALFGVDMALVAGSVTAVIGANGAGKSTLLRSITGLLTNAPEQIVYRGVPIGATAPHDVARLGIAMVPEGRQLFPSLSVEENLKVGGDRAREGNWNLARVYDLFPVLADRRDQSSTSLSGGQQQMVAIGRALMANPDLILFDEISLGLAPVIIRDIYQALPDIVAEGLTALIVEQDISRALEVSSHVYCLQEGRVSLSGDPAQLSREDITKAYFGAL